MNSGRASCETNSHVGISRRNKAYNTRDRASPNLVRNSVMNCAAGQESPSDWTYAQRKTVAKLPNREKRWKRQF